MVTNSSAHLCLEYSARVVWTNLVFYTFYGILKLDSPTPHFLSLYEKIAQDSLYKYTF